MRYTIYKVTNKKTGKYYIGKHQTDNPMDGYFGSGKAIVNAIERYGKDSFVKEVLFDFDTEDEMNRKERELVTEAIVNDPLSYNLGIGGEGGPHFKGKKHSTESKKKFSQLGKTFTKSTEALAKEKQLRLQRNGGKFFSDATREKIRQKAIERWQHNTAGRTNR